MNAQQTRRRVPKITFRVLIIGRANAGKTSILQRVCETTESPVTYRGDEEIELDPSIDRGEHTIDDEIVFSNHRGYIFHDSRGIESGSTEELEILQEFIRRKCGERRLNDRLHAIWYCVPMDNQRPGLDLKFFKGISPDQNVPVIAVFTKHDQFMRNVGMHLKDYPDEYPKGSIVSEVAEKLFQEHYLHPLGDNVRFVRLEKMHMKNRRCDDLIVETTTALNDDVAALMLLAVQRDNIGLSVKVALNRVHSRTGVWSEIKSVIRECLIPFPYIWWFVSGWGGSLCFKPADDGCPRLSSLILKILIIFLLSACVHVLLLSLLTISTFGSPVYIARHVTALSSKCVIYVLQSSFSMAYDTYLSSSPSSVLVVIIWSLVFLFIICRVYLTILEAVVFILKHATFLRLSTPSPELALTRAELEYREANIDLKIRQYLTVSSQEHTIELFADFIMATDIVPSLS